MGFKLSFNDYKKIGFYKKIETIIETLKKEMINYIKYILKIEQEIQFD